MRFRQPASYQITAGIVLTVALLCPLWSAEKKQREDAWRTSETLVSRLSAEWYKIGVLRRELNSIDDVLADLRNIELFPEKLTKLDDDRLVAFDKRIEKIEKQQKKIIDRVEKLRTPLSDAIAILREMVVDKPVKDMLEVLEKGDMERIEEMLAIKHEIDGLWDKLDSLTIEINKQMGFAPFAGHDEEGLDKEFFNIIRANLGKQSEEYYAKLNSIKDSLVERSTDTLRMQALAIEMHQINAYLKQKNWDVALQRVQSMQQRYTDSTTASLIAAVLARIHFALGDYAASLESAGKIGDKRGLDTAKALYTLQSLYALQQYQPIWNICSKLDFAKLPPAKRNFFIWIAMESGMALDIDTDYSKLAGFIAKEKPYQLHVMHALGRSYMRKGRIPIALSVFQSALLIKPRNEIDRKAYRRLLLVTAQALYENKEYNASLKRYFELLDEEGDFEEALYGIAWCYISLGKYQKAETTLRKLINQNPSSPLAAEAILIMARRYANKAQFEWKKNVFLSKEQLRLQQLANKIAARAPEDTTSKQAAKYKAGLKEINDMLARIKAENQVGFNEISSHYDKALDICKIVQKYYETGSFQEIAFSESREKLLHTLDSLLIAVGGEGEDIVKKQREQMRAQSDIQNVKALVQTSTVLRVELDIDRFRWELAYVGRDKAALADAIRKQREQCTQLEEPDIKTACFDIQNNLIVRMDSLIAHEEVVRKDWYKRLTQQCASILRIPLKPEDEIYIRYHLGELHYAQENEDFARAHEQYEKHMTIYEGQMALFNEGKLDQRPPMPDPPLLSHAKSMRQYLIAREKYPNHRALAPVLYSLAWCYSDLGKFDSAVTNMQHVATNYPESKFAPQAWMYLGEHFFDMAYLDKAIKSYKAVMQYPESEWFDEALYKLAWAHYRKSNPGKAISSFLALVDLGEGEKAGKALLEKESLDYIAISFSESDVSGKKGLEQAKMFVNKLGDPDRGTQILQRLAGVYKEQGRFDLSKNTYRTLLEMYPDNRKSPMVESEYIDVLDRDLSLEESSNLKKDFFKKYNRNGRWAKTQTDSTAIAQADSLAAQNLYDASVTFHQMALQNNKRSLYETAAENYEEYINAYPRSPIANECHYNYSEILFSLGNYGKAANEYIAVSKRYPGSKYKETAAWNAIVASQNLLKQEEHVR